MLDAQALIALLLDEVAAAEAQSLLEAGDCGLVITTAPSGRSRLPTASFLRS